ncbi:MAG: GIY-YIG nuclease family protein [Bacteroidetes bacterium]|nr:GIY-YIG nuclease family protein [Bacteroidota bacterium]
MTIFLSTMLYAVVDIETTGGMPGNSRITEVCVVVTDGKNIKQRFETLLNPGVPIPSGITTLTGIDDAMVAAAPVFADIAQELHHLLHDKIFVAHNVNFDYSFIHREFEHLGLPFSVQKVCSAKAARKAFPGQRSYSLGNICAHLQIEIHNRHRAGGDADATATLLERIIAFAGEEILLEMAGRSSRQITLPPGIEWADIEKLPATPGVYYFLGNTGKPLYVGKAINLRKRVIQHFDRKRGKSALQLEQVKAIDFEETGSELMALLVEAEAIHRLWPAWNKAGKLPSNRYAIVHYPTAEGELRLQIARRSRGSAAGIPFSRLGDAKAALSKMISENGICASRAFSNKGCKDPTCYCQESAEARKGIHNARIEQALESHLKINEAFLILCRGRNEEETGVVYMRNGAVCGWGYADEIHANSDPEFLVKKIPDIASTRAIAGMFLRRMLAGTAYGYNLMSLEKEMVTSKESKKKKSTIKN